MEALITRPANEAKSKITKVQVMIERVLEIMSYGDCPMKVATEHFQKLDESIVELEKQIFFASGANQLACFKSLERKQFAVLNIAYCVWETCLEKLFVDDFVSGKEKSLDGYRLNMRFKRLLTRELSMLNNQEINKALFIGSGPFPISAIWLNNLLEIPVDCLDIDLSAIEASGLLINQVGLDNELKLRHETGPNYDVSKYDLIIVALLAKPKKEILDNIFQSMTPDCNVICRTSHGLRNILYEPTQMTRDTLGGFTIRDERVVNGVSDDTISSVLLQRR